MLHFLTFNSKKCTAISLKRQTNSTVFNYSMNNLPPTRAQQAPDLGIQIHRTMKWNVHIQGIISKANQRIWLLNHTLIVLNAPLITKITTYNTPVRSILEYNMVIWNPSTKDNIQALESVQRMATNHITCNPCRPSPLHIEYKDRLLTI